MSLLIINCQKNVWSILRQSTFPAIGSVFYPEYTKRYNFNQLNKLHAYKIQDFTQLFWIIESYRDAYTHSSVNDCLGDWVNSFFTQHHPAHSHPYFLACSARDTQVPFSKGNSNYF